MLRTAAVLFLPLLPLLLPFTEAGGPLRGPDRPWGGGPGGFPRGGGPPCIPWKGAPPPPGCPPPPPLSSCADVNSIPGNVQTACQAMPMCELQGNLCVHKNIPTAPPRCSEIGHLPTCQFTPGCRWNWGNAACETPTPFLNCINHANEQQCKANNCRWVTGPPPGQGGPGSLPGGGKPGGPGPWGRPGGPRPGKPPGGPFVPPPGGRCLPDVWSFDDACSRNNEEWCQRAPSCTWEGGMCKAQPPPKTVWQGADVVLSVRVDAPPPLDGTTEDTITGLVKEDVVDILSNLSTSLTSVSTCITRRVQLVRAQGGFVAVISLSAAGKCEDTAATAKQAWDEMIMNKSLKLPKLANYIDTLPGKSQKLVIAWPDSASTLHRTLDTIRKHVSLLRATAGGSSALITKAEQFLRAKEIGLRSIDNDVDSPRCQAMVNFGDGCYESLVEKRTEACLTDCIAKVKSLLSQPQTSETLLRECTVSTISVLVYANEVLCTESFGELCIHRHHTVLLPMLEALRNGTAMPKQDLANELQRICTPCVAAMAEALDRFEQRMRFLGVPVADVSMGEVQHFLHTVCLSDKGTMCFVGHQDKVLSADWDPLKDTDSLCDANDRCLMMSAAARNHGISDELHLQCIKRPDGQLCGTLLGKMQPNGMEILRSHECNLATIAYSGPGGCIDSLSRRGADYKNKLCSALTEASGGLGCCAWHLVMAGVSTGVWDEEEMAAGVLKLCERPLLNNTCNEALPTSGVAIELTLKAEAEFMRVNKVEMLHRIRGDLASGLGVPLTYITSKGLTLAGGDTAIATYLAHGESPEETAKVHQKVQTLLEEGELTLPLGMEMYNTRHPKGGFAVKRRSSVLQHTSAPRETNCSRVLLPIKADCGDEDLATKVMTNITQHSVDAFCSSACYQAIRETIEDVAHSCSSALAARYVFLAEKPCVMHAGVRCYAEEAVTLLAHTLRSNAITPEKLQTACSHPCLPLLFQSNQRYFARMQGLGMPGVPEDLDEAYSLVATKAACVRQHTTTNLCLPEVSTALASPRVLVRTSPAVLCGTGRSPHMKACMRKVVRLAGEELLKQESAPVNATGAFKAMCVQPVPTEETTCGELIHTVQVDQACDPILLNGSCPLPCKQQLEQRLRILGCCEAHVLDGILESARGRRWKMEQQAYLATLSECGLQAASRCPKKPGKQRTLRIRIDTNYRHCKESTEECRRALLADVLQNTGLHQGHVDDVVLSEGSTIAEVTFSTEDDSFTDAVADGFAGTSTEEVAVSNTNEWVQTFDTRPVKVMDTDATNSGGGSASSSDKLPFAVIVPVAVVVFSGSILFALLRRKQKDDSKSRFGASQQQSLDLTEMGKVNTPSQQYYHVSASVPPQEGGDTMTI